MDAMENRRFNDGEISRLVDRVENLEDEVHKLRVELEEHKVLDDQTHTKMMNEMAVVQNKIDIIMKELISHTKNEEDKFDLIIRNQEQHKAELSKLTIDTAPAVNATRWVTLTAGLVSFLKDTVVPILVGAGAVYMYLSGKGLF